MSLEGGMTPCHSHSSGSATVARPTNGYLLDDRAREQW